MHYPLLNVCYYKIMTSTSDLAKRIESIEKRNATVSLDKKWETSWTRKISIVVLTYIVVVVYLLAIGNDSPWINATVPPIGFFLSTMALGWLRAMWQNSLK